MLDRSSASTRDRDVKSRKDKLLRMYEDVEKAFPAVRFLQNRFGCLISAHWVFAFGPLYKADGFFWQVEAITCKQLQDMMNESDSIVLVDVRSPDEQHVSVLPGNVLRKEEFEDRRQEYTNSKVVTYW